jgi:hypothetical protein
MKWREEPLIGVGRQLRVSAKIKEAILMKTKPYASLLFCALFGLLCSSEKASALAVSGEVDVINAAGFGDMSIKLSNIHTLVGTVPSCQTLPAGTFLIKNQESKQILRDLLVQSNGTGLTVRIFGTGTCDTYLSTSNRIELINQIITDAP